MAGLIQSWFVRVAEDGAPDTKAGRVILEALRTDGGQTDPQMVATFREQATRGRLSVPPTADQEAFLHELEWKRRRGFPVC